MVSLSLCRVVFSLTNSEGNDNFPGGSTASAFVSAFAFYLFQLWDTTDEVVSVMQQTATDIGKPGPDEEFGWGLINADHPLIWDRSIKRLQQSLSFCLLEDVAFEEAVVSAREGFNLFHDANSNKREIGFTYEKSTVALALAAGSALRPFGLSSGFLQQQPNTFTQIGLRHSFADNVSLSGIFGHSSREDMTVRKGSFGVSYQSDFSDTRGNLLLYAGYRVLWGKIGLPGYKTIGISQVPFSLHTPEIRASIGWFF